MKGIQVAFYKEGPRWVAQAPNVEVSSFGETPEEAKASIREALELCFEDGDDVELPDIEFVSVPSA